MQNSQLRVSPRGAFWAVTGEMVALLHISEAISLSHISQPSHPYSCLISSYVPSSFQLKKNFCYCLSHHVLSGLSPCPSARSALSLPACQTPMHPSRPNVHDSSSGRPPCLIPPSPGRSSSRSLGSNSSPFLLY